MATVERLAVLFEVRTHQVKEFEGLWSKRCDLIVKNPLKQKSMEHFPTYPGTSHQSVSGFLIQVNSQLALYRGKKGMFARPYVFEAAKKMPAYMW